MNAMNPKNPNAVALGKLAAGVPKTMTPKAIRARKRAAQFPRPGRRKVKEQPK
jgi:hypothetical protein